MESTIEWQTGTPKCDGYYIVTVLLPSGRSFVSSTYRAGDFWYTLDGKKVPDWQVVVAWFRMSDIQPYREKED